MGDGREWERGRMWEVEGWEERGMNKRDQHTTQHNDSAASPHSPATHPAPARTPPP